MFLVFILISFFIGCATVDNQIQSSNNSADSGENAYSNAIAYLGVNNYELAEINFLKALNKNYNVVGAYYYLGLIEYRKNNYKKSEEYLKKCLNLDDKVTDAHNTLGAIYARQKRYKEAIVEFKKVLQDSSYLFPENALYNLALIHYSLKEFDKSIEYCNKCLYIVPKSPAVYYLLAKNYYRKGNIGKTRIFLYEIIKIFPHNVWSSKAKLFLKQYHLDK